MADEITPSGEVGQNQVPAEPAVVAEVAQSSVVEIPNPLEASIETNPAPVAEPLKMDSGSGSGMTQGGGEESKPTEASLNSAKVESGTVPPSVQVAPRSGIRELLVKAQSVIQFRKRKKLDQIMSLFAKRTSVTNDDVEKLLHVSDATATRYLSILEKEGKIKQTGKTGKGVLYVKN